MGIEVVDSRARGLRPRREIQAAGVADLARRLDWMLIGALVAVTAYGLWAIDGITRNDVGGSSLGHQMVFTAAGVILFLVALFVDPDRYRRLWRPIYFGTLGIMVLVLAAGAATRGSKRWIDVGIFTFQPSEFGKVLPVLALAGLVVERRHAIQSPLTPLAIIGYAIFPILLVFVQPDFGTALVYSAITLGILFVHGAPWRHFVWLGLAGVVVLALVFSILPAAGVQVLQPYQKDRLTSFLHPDRVDTQGDGYHLTQSQIAIGNGGVTGRGVEGATQTRLDYLPEHATDFVFSVVGEERGFVGAAWLLALYMLLIWRGLKLITYSRSTYGGLVAAGVVSMLMFQIFINIGMTIGIAPITGIPLPFMSYGGSHTLTNLLAIGVLQSIHVHAQTADEPVTYGYGYSYG